MCNLGARESGTARLDEAVAAYRAALQEYTRERAPFDWAGTQLNMGDALALLAQRKHDPARMQDAIAAMQDAAEVFREGGVSFWLPIAERRIAAMQSELAAMRAP